MLDHEKINKALSEFNQVIPDGIKVTTEFARCLERSINPLPQYEQHKFYPGRYGLYYQGITIEIDDEIDGPYEFVFNKENKYDRT